MGQHEVAAFLQKKRNTGDHSFFSSREIAKHTKQDYGTVTRSVNRLFAYGYLEIEAPTMFNRRFRLKDRYTNTKLNDDSVTLQNV